MKIVPFMGQGGLVHPPNATSHGNEGDIDVSTWVGNDVSSRSTDALDASVLTPFLAYDEKYVFSS
jgi:hypothetical protein